MHFIVREHTVTSDCLALALQVAAGQLTWLLWSLCWL